MLNTSTSVLNPAPPGQTRPPLARPTRPLPSLPGSTGPPPLPPRPTGAILSVPASRGPPPPLPPRPTPRVTTSVSSTSTSPTAVLSPGQINTGAYIASDAKRLPPHLIKDRKLRPDSLGFDKKTFHSSGRNPYEIDAVISANGRTGKFTDVDPVTGDSIHKSESIDLLKTRGGIPKKDLEDLANNSDNQKVKNLAQRFLETHSYYKKKGFKLKNKHFTKEHYSRALTTAQVRSYERLIGLLRPAIIDHPADVTLLTTEGTAGVTVKPLKARFTTGGSTYYKSFRIETATIGGITNEAGLLKHDIIAYVPRKKYYVNLSAHNDRIRLSNMIIEMQKRITPKYKKKPTKIGRKSPYDP